MRPDGGPRHRAAMAQSRSHQRARYTALLDELGQALVIHDAVARPLHATPGASLLLAGEPRRRHLEAAVRRVAESLATRPRSDGHDADSIELDCGGARYRLRGSFAGPGLFDTRETIVVLLERTPAGPL